MNNTLVPHWTFPVNFTSSIGRSAEDHRRPYTSRARVARVAVELSAGLSTLLGGLIVLFAAMNVDGFRNALTIPYVAAYAVAAHFTRRSSRVAAIGALVLYIPMRHGTCEPLHLTIFLTSCSIYAAGIWGTIIVL